MKKTIAFFLCMISISSTLFFNVDATSTTDYPYVIDFVITEETDEFIVENNETRASGLISAYSLSLGKSGTTLYIGGQTLCSSDVVKSGFKDLTIQRRKSTSDSWEDYYEYGNIYADAIGANLSTTLVVESGYQYRISCKHYAKKNILSVQTIANTSNIVTVA